MGSRRLPGRTIGATLIGTAFVLVLVLHASMRAVNPVRDMISDYARQPHGWLFGLAVLLVATGSVLTLPWRRSARADVFFAGWCAGLVVLAVCRRDVPGGLPTVIGQIHLVAALVALISLPFGVLAAPRRHTLRFAAVACLVMLAPLFASFILGPPLRDVLGLLERVLLVAELAMVVASGSPRAARRDVAVTNPGLSRQS
ncbi:DUF998 domain-containing protein [Winogradskya humida]|uniref:DUF998 domain-containing protein n=1 Tax=Winogradskya humida TaxID=113566 RepID=A0ABQ3ZYJ2_9ACTN|nr:DUF998 domain-containing protein [Actinoplanes humidus]GIE23483.1 hypothetical protein Ahu01nite_065850 [Actinoplanes humidus]